MTEQPMHQPVRVLLSPDQQALEALIAGTLVRMHSPIPPDQLRRVLTAGDGYRSFREGLAGLYRAGQTDDLARLLTDALYTADVLGYWTAERRLGTADWDLPGARPRLPRPRDPVAARTPPDAPRPIGEVLAWVRSAGVAVPAIYYGERSALARSMGDTVANLLALDQMQRLCEASEEAEDAGVAIAEWSAGVIGAGDDALLLPAARLAAVARNLLQGHYASGRCEQFRNEQAHYPELVYSASNDGLRWHEHEAMHGFVAPYDDPVWRQWRPPNGDGCRCRLVSLTAAAAEAHRADDRRRLQADPRAAEARARALREGPGDAWVHDLCADPCSALSAEIDRRLAECPDDVALHGPTAPMASGLPLRSDDTRAALPFSAAERAVLGVIEHYVHLLIRERCQEFGVPVPEDLPRLGDSRPAASSDRNGLNIPGMYGGFGWWFEGEGADLRLITESWSRVVEYSSMRHEISARGIQLLAAGWV